MKRTDYPSVSRAAVLEAHREPLVIKELPVPQELPHGALLVKIEESTICGSDVHLWDGVLAGSQPIDLPVVPGHEMVGRIVAFGDGAEHDSFGTPLALDDRIVFSHSSCGECRACTLLHQPTLCERRDYYMFSNVSRSPYLLGGFSEYCYVFPNSGRVKVPDNVKTSWASAASCAFRTVIHTFDLLGRIEPWETVVIQGAGPLGLFATALASQSGAGQVITIGAPDERLEIAKSYGATETVSVDTHATEEARVDAVRRLLGGKGSDIVMEFSGARTAVTEGLKMIRPGARYTVTGQVGTGTVEIAPGLITRQQVNIIGSWSGHIAEYWKAMQFMSQTQGRFDFDKITSKRYTLDQANDALMSMHARAEIKPVVVPHAEFV
ncbi:zinc-binding dehydrogenase [Georgenia yuyongxinii]|uniref:Zinc-binding dehydrogenase n=1 Tax=Georgenia yuyongxinii TaxID=2589797 RepID=A0A5B8C170_9MICO|nr:zinc-binding dehydrogenase [Georgenia yuyongxinii]QDC23780.1 zinc-binding dehydrogenase [Georgenia yuyongxinii]